MKANVPSYENPAHFSEWNFILAVLCCLILQIYKWPKSISPINMLLNKWPKSISLILQMTVLFCLYLLSSWQNKNPKYTSHTLLVIFLRVLSCNLSTINFLIFNNELHLTIFFFF